MVMLPEFDRQKTKHEIAKIALAAANEAADADDFSVVQL